MKALVLHPLLFLSMMSSAMALPCLIWNLHQITINNISTLVVMKNLMKNLYHKHYISVYV